MNINPKEIIEKGYVISIDPNYPINTDMSSKECQISSNGVDLRIAETVTIDAKSFKNVQILEHFNMNGVFGAIWVRSSFSRKGIFQSSGLFDDGFGVNIENGSIGGISLYNFTDAPINIEKGTRICQIVCWKSNPAKKYNGYYNNNQTIISQY
jgi:deoxycytidine triphosphate deaminase